MLEKCPLCQNENHCAISRGSQPKSCWCMNISIPKPLLENPLLNKKSCICKKCIDKFNKRGGLFNMEIRQVTKMEECIEGLTKLLVKVVDGGASIGFLSPFKDLDAKRYWEEVISDDVILYVATINGVVVGTVQLHLCSKPNGQHRAEIAKLMAHPDHRRLGIGRSLMEVAEEKAKQEMRSLIVLDTREGDPSNLLYSSLGFVKAGRIPNFAISSSGSLDATILYYKDLNL